MVSSRLGSHSRTSIWVPRQRAKISFSLIYIPSNRWRTAFTLSGSLFGYSQHGDQWAAMCTLNSHIWYSLLTVPNGTMLSGTGIHQGDDGLSFQVLPWEQERGRLSLCSDKQALWLIWLFWETDRRTTKPCNSLSLSLRSGVFQFTKLSGGKVICLSVLMTSISWYTP